MPLIERELDEDDLDTVTPTPTPKPTPKPTPSVVAKPGGGLVYNPVTPEKLKQLYDEWQKMTPWEREAATRNQAAAIEAQRRANERKEQARQMKLAEHKAKREKYLQGIADKKAQAEAWTKSRREFNAAQTKAQQARVLAGQVARERRMTALANQRKREHDLRIKQQQQNAARNAILASNRRRDQANAAAARKQKIDAVRRSMQSERLKSQGAARGYFEQQGADYAPYAGSVNAEISRILGGLNPGELATSAMFENVGEDVYNRLAGRGRAAAKSALEPIAGLGFENRLLPDTALDAELQKVQQQHFGEAQSYIDRLLNRGVITQPGYDKALENLKGQVGKVNTQLQDIGSNILAGGRQKLTDIGGQANLAASNLGLGKGFSAAPYSNQLAEAVKRFQSGIPGAISTQVQGPLFDTTNLANIAGKATGAQNTGFDPYALSNVATPKQPLFDTSTGMRSVF